MRSRTAVFAAQFIGIIVAVLAATRASAETPEEFSARYIASMRKDGLKGFSAFIHETELKKLHDLVIQVAELSAKSGSLEEVPFVKKGETTESLRKLSPAELSERFFAWVSEVAPQLTEMLKTADAKIIGHLTDGDTVYVVTKLTFEMEGEPVTATDVLPLKKSGDNYKALLKAELSGILKGMKKQLARKTK